MITTGVGDAGAGDSALDTLTLMRQMAISKVIEI
jgi:hypothetical protein